MNIALVFAGGTGQRMISSDLPKQFLKVDNTPILVHTLKKFNNHNQIDSIIVVTLGNWLDYTMKLVDTYKLDKVLSVVAGGKTAQESQMYGLSKIVEMKLNINNPIILIHDGVRPLIDMDTISRNIDTTMGKGNSITVTKAIETVIYVATGNKIDRIFDRELCWMARAPQCFYFDDIFNCHLRSIKDKKSFIDSATMMKHYGHSLNITEGNSENIKITTPTDFDLFVTLNSKNENVHE